MKRAAGVALAGSVLGAAVQAQLDLIDLAAQADGAERIGYALRIGVAAFQAARRVSNRRTSSSVARFACDSDSSVSDRDSGRAVAATGG